MFGLHRLDGVASLERQFRAEGGCECRRLGERLNRAGVHPVACELVADQLSSFEVVIQQIGNLELAPRRRSQVLQRAEDRWSEEVHPDRDKVALGDSGLLLEVDDAPIPVQLRHAESLRVRDAF